MAATSSPPDNNLSSPLPEGVTDNYVFCPSNNLNMHFLEAGYTPERTKPLLLLVHGFPELAFSWRKIMLPLAKAGYYVVAYDQRGYGRTTGWDTSSFAEVNMEEFTMTNLVRDAVIFVHALGYREVRCIIGHDFGAVTAGMCAWMRPDFFKAVVTMSHPFKARPALPFNIAHSTGDNTPSSPVTDVHKDLANLPQPRKHYKWYNSAATSASDWNNPPQGLQTFLRGYFHVKSANWEGNNPHPLKSWTAEELAKMPFYYILPYSQTMPETIAQMMQTENVEDTTKWLSDADLAFYVQEWSRTGFQGGLNWYRTATDAEKQRDLHLFAGKKIECPALFVSGAKDWGNYQEPGAVEGLEGICERFEGVRIVEGAGHWVQQEQPARVVDEVLEFLGRL